MTAQPSPGRHVSIRDAVKRYGEASALDGVDLEIEAGQFTVLLGPSGSGKSTLIRCVAGIERLDRGTIHFDDECVSGPRRHVPPNSRNLAMVFQDYALWPHLTALGNIGYALRRRRLDRAAVDRRSRAALERVGLGGYERRYPNELSGGEQQRVGLARAIVADPELLLFDEPLSNLDTDLRERMRLEIATVTRESGCTAVYITHDQAEAFALADRVGVLKAGRLEQFGPPEEIYRHPGSPFVARFTGIAGQLTGRVMGRRGEHLIVQCGPHRLACRPGGTVRGGDAVTVYVRPGATVLLPANDPPTTGAMPARVVDTAYRGRGYDHVLDCGETLLTSVFDARAWPRGGACTVAVDPDGCTAFAGAPTTELDATAVRSIVQHDTKRRSSESLRHTDTPIPAEELTR